MKHITQRQESGRAAGQCRLVPGRRRPATARSHARRRRPTRGCERLVRGGLADQAAHARRRSGAQRRRGRRRRRNRDREATKSVPATSSSSRPASGTGMERRRTRACATSRSNRRVRRTGAHRPATGTTTWTTSPTSDPFRRHPAAAQCDHGLCKRIARAAQSRSTHGSISLRSSGFVRSSTSSRQRERWRSSSRTTPRSRASTGPPAPARARSRDRSDRWSRFKAHWRI